jgi:glycosyltransferase involved in cell wall biosynthesis
MNKVHVIPYGVDTEEFQRGIVPNGGRRHLSILHAGRIVPKKGVPDLITVFSDLRRKHDQLQLHILGDGRERKHCEELVSQYELSEAVVFHGAQGQSVVKDLMRACDIFVLNSRTDDSGDMEGLPNTILEAMSMEKPVVSTFHAGIPQAINSGKNGLLVAEKNNKELAMALERLIVDPALRESLGKNARQTVLQNFRLENMQDRLYNVISSAGQAS